MTDRRCVVEGCGKPARRHRRSGLCSMHDTRVQRHGSLDDPRRSVEQRIHEKYVAGTADECWPWLGAISNNGYGNVAIESGRGGKATAAHRAVYTLLVGPIPGGLQIDHLCRNRACVNPAHLEPVTGQENVRRAAALRVTCASGHPFSPENTTHLPSRPTVRLCRECRRATQRQYRARKAAAA